MTLEKINKEHWKIMQTKTFTKWINIKLKKFNFSEINDLFLDFQSGINLRNLLIALKTTPPEIDLKCKIKIKKIINLNKLLNFIENEYVKLVNIGPEDIYEGEQKLILGLVWSIISKISINKSIKNEFDFNSYILLDWVKNIVKPYKNIEIKNFTTSWQDGRAFNAIINFLDKDLIKYNLEENSFYNEKDKSLIKENFKSENEFYLTQAFDLAQSHLNIPKLLDVEDLAFNYYPDEKSIITYILQFYEKFKKVEKENLAKNKLSLLLENLNFSFKNKEEFNNNYNQFLDNKKNFNENLENLNLQYKNFIFNLKMVSQDFSELFKSSLNLSSNFFSIKTLDFLNNFKNESFLNREKEILKNLEISAKLPFFDSNLIKTHLDLLNSKDFNQLEQLQNNLKSLVLNESNEDLLKNDFDFISLKMIKEALFYNYEFENNKINIKEIKESIISLLKNINEIKKSKNIFENKIKDTDNDYIDLLKLIEDKDFNFNLKEKMNKLNLEEIEKNYKNFSKIGNKINSSDFKLLEIDENNYNKEEFFDLLKCLLFNSYSKKAIPGIFKILNKEEILLKEINNSNLEFLLKNTNIKDTIKIENIDENLNK